MKMQYIFFSAGDGLLSNSSVVYLSSMLARIVHCMVLKYWDFPLFRRRISLIDEKQTSVVEFTNFRISMVWNA